MRLWQVIVIAALVVNKFIAIKIKFTLQYSCIKDYMQDENILVRAVVVLLNIVASHSCTFDALMKHWEYFLQRISSGRILVRVILFLNAYCRDIKLCNGIDQILPVGF